MAIQVAAEAAREFGGGVWFVDLAPVTNPVVVPVVLARTLGLVDQLDVVRLVSAGLPNKDIAARLFVSPRTVQTHLTHVYAKLAVSSRVQLAREAARHT
ncbi:hypothetical protein MMAN_33490 [Mycobacterium mantenii]|uniref:HTH luxR-type domain-containing protein n=1 Tax=Mycobacterium mantenii TaxID=560555 RepID=A0ABM7JUG4_MYCNT|nr:helix-turn-helix transcriptional regulator [Mycobacterium mantenii]BBY39215.1 hypothetical protein MMAN_33490 [Mycobacterium mantenii]